MATSSTAFFTFAFTTTGFSFAFAATSRILQTASTRHFSTEEREMSQTRKKGGLWPLKYFKGLTRKQALKRQKEISFFGKKDTTDPKAYVGFQTDKGVKTKTSSYTKQWDALFPNAKSLKDRAKATGIPLPLLQESYDRGMAAWRTGHRPGATQQQWGYARVSSLSMCGKTHYTTDSDLVRKAKKQSRKAKKWFSRCSVSKTTKV